MARPGKALAERRCHSSRVMLQISTSKSLPALRSVRLSPLVSPMRSATACDGRFSGSMQEIMRSTDCVRNAKLSDAAAASLA